MSDTGCDYADAPTNQAARVTLPSLTTTYRDDLTILSAQLLHHL